MCGFSKTSFVPETVQLVRTPRCSWLVFRRAGLETTSGQSVREGLWVVRRLPVGLSPRRRDSAAWRWRQRFINSDSHTWINVISRCCPVIQALDKELRAAQRARSPCLMSIHANTFPPHTQRDRQTERECNTGMKHQLQLYLMGTHTHMRGCLYWSVQSLQPITSKPPSSHLHLLLLYESQWASSLQAVCLSGKPWWYYARCRQGERERNEDSGLPSCRFVPDGQMHISPPALCLTLSSQATILLSQTWKTVRHKLETKSS